MPRGSKPGERRGGRAKGTPNKTTALLKDAILQAGAEAHEGGLVGYLRHQANESPAAFLTLLGKVLPLQITGDKDAPLQHHVTIEIIDK